jgi:hypothetical protein
MNINELNQFVQNLFDRINVKKYIAAGSYNIKKWMIENISLVGRYSYKDGESFGNYWTIENDLEHYDRQDGWESLTEEVNDINELHYGTGMLYVRGEMEIPPYEDGNGGPAVSGDNILGDEYGQTDRNGRPRIKDFALHCYKMKGFSDVGLGKKHFERFDLANDQDKEGSVKVDICSTMGASGQRSDPHGTGGYNGYVYNWTQQGHQRADSKWLLEYVAENIGGVWHEGAQPPGFNQVEHSYFKDTERNLFPWLVVMSTRPKTIKKFLEDWEGETGPYGRVCPLAEPAYPPIKYNGIKYVKGEIDGIVDFLSPLTEVPD